MTFTYNISLTGFRRFHEIENSDYYLRHVCLSVRTSVYSSEWNNATPTGRTLMKFDVWRFIEKLSRKFKLH